jgi:hypothetical protein
MVLYGIGPGVIRGDACLININFLLKQAKEKVGTRSLPGF